MTHSYRRFFFPPALLVVPDQTDLPRNTSSRQLAMAR